MDFGHNGAGHDQVVERVGHPAYPGSIAIVLHQPASAHTAPADDRSELVGLAS